MSNEDWLSKYLTNKEAVWLRCKLTDGSQHYHDQFKGWIEIKKLCEENGCFVEELKLSYRSHEVNIDLSGAEAVYLIKAVMGQIGARTKQYLTTGVLKKGTVYKQMWLIPELIVDKELEDDLSECFEQALIYNEEKKQN